MSKHEAIRAILGEELTGHTLDKIVFSRPNDKKVKKAVAKLFKKGDEIFCQIESFTTDNKAKHENIPLTDAVERLFLMTIQEFVQTDIFSKNGFCEILVSKKGHIHIADKRKKDAVSEPIAVAEHNRQKQYLLDAKEHAHFLSLLGVCDEKGKIFEKKRSKFRQINRFLELLNDVYDKLPQEGSLTVCDLCCGKSYLTFAVYYYLTALKKRTVMMYGVDLKEDVITYCKEVSKMLGCEGLQFLCRDITEFSLDGTVDMVVSLHACDIATDIVLEKAAKWRTDVILSTPCCHHELNHNISSPQLSFITDHSMLRQKLCDAATDALRLCRLESKGYAVAALELIDPDETPKNIMLRAVRRKNFDEKSKEAAEAKERYLKAKAFLCGEDKTGDFHF